MEPLRVDTMLLRTLAPDLLLRPGATLAGRVAERHGRHGVLMLAGTPLTAELPDNVRAGDTLRLVVQEAGPERVVLRIAEQAQPPQPPPAPPVAIPLPDGRQAHVRVEQRGDEEREGARAEDRHTVALVYESPALGALDLVLAVEPAGAHATVRARPGDALTLAGDAAAELRDALSRALGRPAEVTVAPRRDPLDAYA